MINIKRNQYRVAVALLAVSAATAVSAAAPSFAPSSKAPECAKQLATKTAWSETNYRPGDTPRRVIVSGYHPSEGFETETAAEDQARAARTPIMAER